MILFVDLGFEHGMEALRMGHQFAPDALPVMSGIDEQAVEMRSRQPHEPDRIASVIDRQPQGRLRQVARHIEIYRRPILRRQEIMRRVDRAPPDFDDGWTI